MGRFGQKTGRGWSSYDAARKPSSDPETTALIEQVAREAGIERRRIPAEEIVDRCVYGLVNEGARLLEEGIALRASDIDVVYLTGFGFPVWRGGPMFYADTVGLPQVLKRIEEFQAKHGPGLWTPRPCCGAWPRAARHSCRGQGGRWHHIRTCTILGEVEEAHRSC